MRSLIVSSALIALILIVAILSHTYLTVTTQKLLYQSEMLREAVTYDDRDNGRLLLETLLQEWDSFSTVTAYFEDRTGIEEGDICLSSIKTDFFTGDRASLLRSLAQFETVVSSYPDNSSVSWGNVF